MKMFLQSGVRNAPRKTLVHGMEGVGKTTFAASFPAPFYIGVEEGANDIDVERIIYDEAGRAHAVSYAEVRDAILFAATGEHDRKTLIVDTLDALERLIWADVCATNKVQSMEDIGFGKAYVQAMSWWAQILQLLEQCRTRGMEIVLIAHSVTQAVNDPETQTYDRYVPKLHKSAWPMLVAWADEVFFCRTRIDAVKTEEQGVGAAKRTRGRALSAGQRVLRTTERPAFVAKNRLCLPDELALDFDAYWAARTGTPLAS